MTRSSGRLSRSGDFLRAYRAGRSVANRYMVLYYFGPPGAESREAGPRVGFSVSKRLGNAVERNRVKRVLRESYRANSGDLTGDVDLVFVARPAVVDLLESEGQRAVARKMAEVLQKASLANGDVSRQ